MKDPSGFIKINIANMRFIARLERNLSPITCQKFCAILPFRAKVIQARWSGEAAWIPLSHYDLGVGKEGITGNPSAGEILFHPADHSECEMLIPYGKSAFRCKDGDLVGNHFLTIVEGQQLLEKLGELVLWHGSQNIEFSHSS
ncbi:MAG: DUF3830 family protein [Candidatus Acidiferrales bacterium]